MSATITPVKPKQLFPFLDLQAQFATIKDEIMSSIASVMESQHFILGPEVAKFESEVGSYVGAKAAIGCASGSDALLLALLALNLEAGDEVITTPFTFVATAGSIARVGARPVFVDIDPDTYNIDVKQIDAAITSRTRALMPVHLFGLASDLKPILELASPRGLGVIEDAAQAIGARYDDQMVGNLGTFGCFSFFPSKNLGGAGDGGMITTNDASLAARLKLIRVHGSAEKYRYEILGVNSRLDALQAAILRVKLRYLSEWAEARREHADYYRTLLAGHGLESEVRVPVEPANCYHVYNQFTIRVPKRDQLREHLAASGIPTEVYYPSPLHVQPAFTYLGYKQGQFPNAEAASREVVSLPIYPELTHDQQELIVDAIVRFYRG